MIDSKYRKLVQPGFDWFGLKLKKMNISPAQVTLSAFLIGLLASLMIALGHFTWAILFLWLSGFLDVLDGTLARLVNRASPKGAYMDLIFDRLVEVGVIFAFYLTAPDHVLAYLFFYIGLIFNFSTFIVAGALFQNKGQKSMYYDIGLVERTETFVFFTAMLIFTNAIFEILMVFNAIMILTACIRFYKVMKYDPYNNDF